MNIKNNKILVLTILIFFIATIIAGSIILLKKQAEPKIPKEIQQQIPVNNMIEQPAASSNYETMQKSIKEKNPIEQEINDYYEKSSVGKISPIIEYTFEAADYDMYSLDPVNVIVRKSGEKVGNFEGYHGGTYIPVYLKGDDLFIASYCAGIGGMCRGDFIKYNLQSRKTTTIAEGTSDFFLNSDSKELIIFTIDENWETYNIKLYEFEPEKMIDQTIEMKCSDESNIRKNCKDIFLQKGDDIIFLPFGYDNMKVGDAYKLTRNIGLPAFKFEMQSGFFQNFNIIFPLIALKAEDNPSLKTYYNEKHGFEFKYPKEWPIPVLDEEKYSSNGGYPSQESSWRLSIGQISKGACEGEDCYELYFDGYQNMNYDSIVKDLKSDDLIEIKEEKIIDNGKMIIYSEGGMCGNKNAFIVNEKWAIKMSSHCGDEDQELSDQFDKIISTFRFAK